MGESFIFSTYDIRKRNSSFLICTWARPALSCKQTNKLFNPYCTTVLVRGRQNHVVLQTSYLRNGKELDRNIQYFFKEEEIAYNMSNF